MYKSNSTMGFQMGSLGGTCKIKGVANSLPNLLMYIIEIESITSGSIYEYSYDCILCPESSLFELT